jgi:type VI secretion system protein VasG
VSLNLKSLVSKLTDHTRRGLEGAAGLCLSRTHYEVELEHWFMKLGEGTGGDFDRILRHFAIDPDRFLRDLDKSLDQYKTGNGGRPQLAPSLEDVMREGWVLSSINLGTARVRSGALLLAALNDRHLQRRLLDASPDLRRIKLETLERELATIVAGSPEDREVFALGAGAPVAGGVPGGGAAGVGAGAATPALDQYTIDLTAEAQAGRVDPVLGRDAEIRQIIDILTRRRQNNPILTGEAGVGKTAVVEGFALRIAAGDVPPILHGVALRTLDLGLLQAGAGVKGEFENRLKQVIAEVKTSARPIILFIDEAHTMIGAGGQEGQNDAANLLKPALARGELRTIAATTWAEYKRYFEKDPALSRRFQVVKVEEPTESAAVEMMRGLSPKLEKHHGVRILDGAVSASVKLSHRYIPARQLPDKSVSVLDTACARVAIGRSATPAPVEDLHRRLDAFDTETRILQRESALGLDHAERLAEIAAVRAEAAARLVAMEARWKQELELVDRLVAVRTRLEGEADQAGADGAKPPTKAEQAKLRAELDKLRGQLAQLQGEQPLVGCEVSDQTIAEVISGWTGIPTGRMVADEIQTVLHLADRLRERVIGQDHGLEAVARRIRTARAGLDNPSRPVGVFLLVGPSGVGKTETALALAEALYGGERNLITINMSEYQEAHTVSSLKGAPPGYVGYGEGGVLTEAVRRRPYAVVLLDEVEKAHSDVMELFYQVFDKGMLEDGQGREIDFKNTVILLTSNVGSDTIMKLCADPETCPEPAGLAEAIRPELLRQFPAALLGRMVVVPYYPIAGEALRRIIRLQLGRIARRVRENHRVEFVYGDDLLEAIAVRCTEAESGARAIDHLLTQTLLPQISVEFLTRLAASEPFSRVEVVVDQGTFQYRMT